MAAGGPQMPTSRFSGDSPGRSAARPLRSAPRQLSASSRAGSGAGRRDPSPPPAAGGGRALSRRLLAVGPRLWAGARDSGAAPAPAGSRRQAPVWAPGFLLQLHLKDDMNLVHVNLSHCFWKDCSPRGARVCSCSSQMEEGENVPHHKTSKVSPLHHLCSLKTLRVDTFFWSVTGKI